MDEHLVLVHRGGHGREATAKATSATNGFGDHRTSVSPPCVCRQWDMRLTLRVGLVVVETLAFSALLAWSAGAYGVRSAGFAFLVVWLTMCWLTLLSFSFPLRLPADYYRLRPWERDGRLYERLGVRVAKRLLRRGPLTVFNPHLRLPPVLDTPSLAKLETAMRFAETAHTTLFLLTLPVIGHALVRGWWDAAGWTSLFTVVVNAYPTILQRYNRGRLADRSTDANG
jgi:hypothetical protein